VRHVFSVLDAADRDHQKAKIIVALGAVAAKNLLGLNDSMANPSRPRHDFKNTKLAVTYIRRIFCASAAKGGGLERFADGDETFGNGRSRRQDG